MPKGQHLKGRGGPGAPKGVTNVSRSKDRWLLKIEMAVRFMIVNVNISDAMIAAHIGVSPVTLSMWKKTPEWQRIHDTITTRVLGDMDSEIKDDLRLNRLRLQKIGVPTALNNLLEMAMSRTNDKLRLAASRELLDRSGHFSKVTRIGLPSEDQGGVSDSLDNDTAKELVDALSSIKSKESAEPASIQSPPPTDSIQ
jgi:hypothetical protein